MTETSSVVLVIRISSASNLFEFYACVLVLPLVLPTLSRLGFPGTERILPGIYSVSESLRSAVLGPRSFFLLDSSTHNLLPYLTTSTSPCRCMTVPSVSRMRACHKYMPGSTACPFERPSQAQAGCRRGKSAQW